MEGKNTNDAKSRISLLNKDQIKSDLYRLSNSRLFFNSVTGDNMHKIILPNILIYVKKINSFSNYGIHLLNLRKMFF